MLPQHEASASSNILYPAHPGGKITEEVIRVVKALLERVKLSIHRIAYGDQTDLGAENLYTYDPESRRWVLRGTVEKGQVGSHLGDALPPPPAEIPHTSHEHCVAPHINPLVNPSPFRGVFKRASALANLSLSTVDMAALSHPVYAPCGSVLEGVTSQEPPKPRTPEATIQVVRTSPFSR